MVRAEVVCFCDIPADDLGLHMTKYGPFGISFPKIVHPTCELGKASVTNVHVARVQPLNALPDENQRQQVVAGISEKDGGLRIAFAHTFFVAPVEGSALDIPMWADFRRARPRAAGTVHTGRAPRCAHP